MSALSPCHTQRPPRRSGESVMSLFVIMGFAGYALAFGVGQLQLRFSVDEMKQETTRLQAKKMELQSELKSMRAEVESCKQGERLVVLAQSKFGLEPYTDLQAGELAVPEFVKLRYAAPEVEDPYGVVADSQSFTWLSKVATRIGLDGVAFAADEETR